MKRIAFRLAVALPAFTVGVATAALWLSINAGRPYVGAHVVTAPPTPSEPAEPFTFVGGMSALTLDHGDVNSELYKAADGSQVSYSRESYRSPAQAVRELRGELKDAERVIEQSPVKDEDGERIGERVVVLWRANKRGWARTSVLWTRGSKSYSINAESPEHALEFERNRQEKR
jgi:hypothetical protein